MDDLLSLASISTAFHRPLATRLTNGESIELTLNYLDMPWKALQKSQDLSRILCLLPEAASCIHSLVVINSPMFVLNEVEACSTSQEDDSDLDDGDLLPSQKLQRDIRKLKILYPSYSYHDPNLGRIMFHSYNIKKLVIDGRRHLFDIRLFDQMYNGAIQRALTSSVVTNLRLRGVVGISAKFLQVCSNLRRVFLSQVGFADYIKDGISVNETATRNVVKIGHGYEKKQPTEEQGSASSPIRVQKIQLQTIQEGIYDHWKNSDGKFGYVDSEDEEYDDSQGPLTLNICDVIDGGEVLRQSITHSPPLTNVFRLKVLNMNLRSAVDIQIMGDLLNVCANSLAIVKLSTKDISRFPEKIPFGTSLRSIDISILPSLTMLKIHLNFKTPLQGEGCEIEWFLNGMGSISQPNCLRTLGIIVDLPGGYGDGKDENDLVEEYDGYGHWEDVLLAENLAGLEKVDITWILPSDDNRKLEYILLRMPRLKADKRFSFHEDWYFYPRRPLALRTNSSFTELPAGGHRSN
ncbi:hypothetical protein JR316_0006527 [Psilocybe cubensis]|uniref:Uncharacterized protein n=2 Tax=Psilocybe cubensis TaxID=181762 RepID=A0A8H8CDW8_PSICU|nr:hypothetical protein JR316_0006527 [Psilocybe cubensis]KAH9481997.1 hypothetical protein JR316_0006527 [Psilocybe cubensis]